MKVFKFGGASVKNAQSFGNVADILRKHAVPPVIIVMSAIDKTTNKLEELVKAYYYRSGDTAAILDSIKRFHLGVAGELFPDKSHNIWHELENIFVELQWAVDDEPAFGFNQHYDQIVALGEILSTKIASAFLNAQGFPVTWLDARGMIRTDNNYREGRVDFDVSARLIREQLSPETDKGNFVLTQGFIGGTSENYITTLGREGSDYTAALLAYFTDAKEVVIWKDVGGVMNADPKFFRNTQKLDELSYHDAIELAYYGASVIHPRTIKPLENKKIPLQVRSFLRPDEKGTMITGGSKRVTIPTYIFKTDQILISIEPKDFSFIAEDKLSKIFAALSKHNIRVNMMHNSAISFSICCDNDPFRYGPLIAGLSEDFRILYNEGVQLMTVRNYSQEIIAKLCEGREILLEQKSRNTHQMVMR